MTGACGLLEIDNKNEAVEVLSLAEMLWDAGATTQDHWKISNFYVYFIFLSKIFLFSTMPFFFARQVNIFQVPWSTVILGLLVSSRKEEVYYQHSFNSTNASIVHIMRTNLLRYHPLIMIWYELLTNIISSLYI